jgi:Flp pilus assembly protein TadD
MVASGRMEDAQRRQALRALAGMALSSGREETAVERLEQLAEAGADPRSLANLAALHARAGRMDQARLRMSQAVAQVRRQGRTPDEEWTAFLAQPN